MIMGAEVMSESENRLVAPWVSAAIVAGKTLEITNGRNLLIFKPDGHLQSTRVASLSMATPVFAICSIHQIWKLVLP